MHARSSVSLENLVWFILLHMTLNNDTAWNRQPISDSDTRNHILNGLQQTK